MLRRDADVAVRMTQPTQGALVVRRVGSAALGLFASERYLKARGIPHSVSDLSHEHSLVGRDRDDSFYAALASVGVRVKKRDFSFRTASDVARFGRYAAGFTSANRR